MRRNLDFHLQLIRFNIIRLEYLSFGFYLIRSFAVTVGVLLFALLILLEKKIEISEHYAVE